MNLCVSEVCMKLEGKQKSELQIKPSNQNITWEPSFLTRRETRTVIRFNVTGKVCYLFILRLVFSVDFFSSHLFAGFLNLYKQHFLLYCVRKWENQLKRLFSLYRRLLWTQNYDQFPSGYLQKWTGKGASRRKERKKNSILIQTDYFRESNWLHFDFLFCFSPKFSRVVIYLLMKLHEI